MDDSSESETEHGSHDGGSESREKPNPHSAKDRWGKLKTTMAATNHISVKKNRRLDRGDSFLRKFSTRNQAEIESSQNTEDLQGATLRNTKHRTLKSFVIHPSGGFMFYWLGVVNISVLYNLWTCIAREAFREIQKGYMAVWFCLDGLCDFVYICDIFVQFRTGYLQQGLMVYDSTKLCRNYLKDRYFIADLVSLLPLDFLQFYTGVHPMLRFPRFLKIYRSIRFMQMYESRTAYPNLLRVASLSHILFLGSHWFAAFYYLISEAEGFEGDWSYPKPVGHFAAVTRKYLASLYWSTLTLTTIGDLPPPDTNWQYVFVIVSYLIGVFIFATIVGQVGNVITNRNASRQEFERLLDGAKFYMQMHNVPPELQKRVQRWYDYVWTRGRLNCNDINSLGLLPDKLKTELALHVNLGTLKKVTIFQKCRPEFLHDLMLKMRAYIFTPGDLICRRGEVAREMFIIADGVVEILGDNNTVLTQMSTGDFFGEIGILNLDGGINRRTADVRSVGYSELFVLSREDVLAALKDHPDAEEVLTRSARTRLEDLLSSRNLAMEPDKLSVISSHISEEINESEKHTDSERHRNGISSVQENPGMYVVFKHSRLYREVEQEMPHTKYTATTSAQGKSIQTREQLQTSIIREYGQRRLKETVEHRKMVKSAPSSPEISSFRVNRGSNKVYTENSNPGLCRPQVKYLQKIPYVSPKLKKLFHLKNRRVNKGRQRRHSDSPTHELSNTEESKSSTDFEQTKKHLNDNGIKNPLSRLNIIDEKEHSFTDSEVDMKHDHVNKAGGGNLAELVLNLLKSKRQVGYKSVQSDDIELEKQFDDIPIANLNEITTDSCTKSKHGCNMKDGCDNEIDKHVNAMDTDGCNRLHAKNEHEQESRENNMGLNCTLSPNLFPPKIVLTHDDDRLTSGSSENESEVESFHEKPTFTNRLPFRNHTGRKSSPCILPLPIKTGTHRKYSCPPPLDLPIEVPPFSNFRGLTGNSTEISFSLDRFRTEIEQRLGTMETSYKETQEHLNDALSVQEKLIRNILKKLVVREKSVDEVPSTILQPEVTGMCNDMRSNSQSNTTSGSMLYKRSLSQGDANTNSSVQMSPHIGHATRQTETIVEESNDNATKYDDVLNDRNELGTRDEQTTSGTNENDKPEVDNISESRITHL